jgi:hypothetical protein
MLLHLQATPGVRGGSANHEEASLAGAVDGDDRVDRLPVARVIFTHADQRWRERSITPSANLH